MIHRLIFLLLAISMVSSCKEEFTLEGEFQDVPTAFAFLNADDERHFVRVQKAFLEAGGNALDNAAIADSIYYGENDAMVVLENLTTTESIELERVNAEIFGLNREDGVFASSPNILYTVEDEDFNLRHNDRVRLSIIRPGEDDAVAETIMLNEITNIRPDAEVRLSDYRTPQSVTWRTGENAQVYKIEILMNVRELFPGRPDDTRNITLVWEVETAFVPLTETNSSSVRYLLDKQSFYRFIGENLEEDPTVRRRFLGFDIRITAGGQEVLDRRTLANANSGITSSQILPRYTNVEGGIGMVTSTSIGIVQGISLDPASLDSLKEGFFTRDLNF